MAETRIAPLTSPEGRTQVEPAAFLRRSLALRLQLWPKSWEGQGGGDSEEEGVRAVAVLGAWPLCVKRLDIFLSICGTLLRDNVRVFLHTCSCFCFSVLKSVCVLTCPLQYPYRYICCVPYEMLGSGKSNQPTHRLLTVSTSAFD